MNANRRLISVLAVAAAAAALPPAAVAGAAPPPVPPAASVAPSAVAPSAFAPSAVAPSAAAAAPTLKGPVGWDTYRHLDRFDELTRGVQTKQFSSFDRAGGNGDFNRCLSTRTDGGCVLASATGAGEVDSIWSTVNGGDVTQTGDLTVVLDGRTVLHAPFQDIVDGKLGAPFVFPVVANADQSSGGVYIQAPMTYRRSMLVYTQHDPDYYHVTYRAFADANGVSTFDPADKATDVIAALTAAGTRDPKPARSSARTSSSAFTLAPGATRRLASVSGAGTVSALRLRLPQLVGPDAPQAGVLASDDVLRHARLRVTVDGTRTVDAPLGEFFGSGQEKASVRSLMTSMSSALFAAWWPMPYARSLQVALVNGSSHAITSGRSAVTYAADRSIAGRLAAGAIGYFRATSHAADTTQGQDYPFLDTTGTGKFVGVVQGLQGPTTRAYLEGDERVYVDGALSPAIHGTGTEDFYEGGWYFNRDTFTDPINGNPSHQTSGTAGCPTGFDCTGTYRLMLADAVPFAAGIHVGIEHGGVDDVAAQYSSTAFWYGSAAPTARVSDTVDVGSHASERRHGYTSTALGAVTVLTSSYEGNDAAPQPVREDSRSTTAPVSFRVAVDRNNTGVVLRRTSDQAVGGQSAAMSVNGHAVGTWSQPLSNDRHRWLDDTFAIPAAFTAGRDHVTVTVTPSAGVPAWNAARYVVQSTVGRFTDTSAPSRVTDLHAAPVGDSNAIDVTWKPATDDVAVDHYEVYASRTAPVRPSNRTLVGTPTWPGFEHTGLGLSQRWHYRVVAVDSSGHRGPVSADVAGVSGNVIRLEAESLPVVEATAPVESQGNCCNVIWSANAQLWFRPASANQHVTVSFTVPQTGTYAMSSVQTSAPDYGITTLAVDGKAVGSPRDGYATTVLAGAPDDDGQLTLTAGTHTLTLTVTGKNPAATNYLAGLDYVQLRPVG